ncbi:hypothetical protein BRC2024_KWYBBTRE_CDS_0246 [Acinetobacter phage vB_AbaM_AB-Navy-v2]
MFRLHCFPPQVVSVIGTTTDSNSVNLRSNRRRPARLSSFKGL